MMWKTAGQMWFFMAVSCLVAPVACTGDAGPAGAPGLDGTDGTDGTNGDDGMDGTDGTDGTDDNGTGFGRLQFEPVAFPQTDADKRAILASSFIDINGQSHSIDYHVVLRAGDQLGPNTFGLIVDQNMMPVTLEDNAQYISNAADFSSLLQVGGTLYQVTHLETQPGGMYLTELSQDAEGQLTAISTAPIDFSGVDGLWVPCAGSVTPWNTHLGSEEYPPDAYDFEQATTVEQLHPTYTRPQLLYFGLDIYSQTNGMLSLTMAEVNAVFNPYFYGYPVEVAVAEGGSTTVTKHYAMGRMALELAYMMPDQKTVYMTDDGTNVGLYMFVADNAGDLSAGTLYAMKWHQTSPDGSDGGSADIEWVDLGHASHSEVDAMIHTQQLAFSDIWDIEPPNADGTCSTMGFVPVNAGSAGSNAFECLRLKTGMEVAASRLETSRYANYLGATTELRKEEGITYDPASHTLFIAMSAIERGMESFGKSGAPSTQYDYGTGDDVRLAYNHCGAVYALDVAPSPTLSSDYVAQSWRALVTGTPMNYAANSPYAGNSCSVNGIANPDNVTFIEGYDTLIIGEDTGSGHQNDAIWAYNMLTGKLTRIMTTPYGSETTSPYFYPDLGGFAYLTAVVQHPYGESDQGELNDPLDARAYVGYIGPLPAMP